MNTVLWILQGILAAVYLGAGLFKLTKPIPFLTEKLGWPADFEEKTVRMIGAAETAGAAGLILPWATGILTFFTPLAALGLATVMVLAMRVHARRHETPAIMANVVLAGALVFVALGRFGVLG